MKTTSDSLVPGDIISVIKEKGDGGDMVCADVVLLRGSAVVSEASLTGESVPQMKEGLVELNEFALNIKAKHKNHVMYAGTKMLQVKGENSRKEGDDDYVDVAADAADVDAAAAFAAAADAAADADADVIPTAPDGGCVCFVLRTGFLSAQGKLVRMIESSQEKVKGEQKEIGLLLLFLLVFAVLSSGYVLVNGWKDDNRSHYELLLHCILIITSVIPPELPMQLALAVNSSLMTLMKMQVFCTEVSDVFLFLHKNLILN